MTLHQISATIDNDKFKRSLASSLLLSLTLFFFGPIHLYYTNIREIPFLFSDIWYYILATSIVVGFCFFLLLMRLDEPYHTTLSALVFALGLLFWIQGYILVWDYGLLDGHEIIFKNYFWNGVIDSMTWICIFIGAFLYRKQLYRHIGVLCALLLIMQAAGLITTVYSAPDEPDWKTIQESPDLMRAYQLSSNANVIIIILDTFQSDVFQEIIDEDPKYRDMFEGFTYYRNNVGGFPTTYPSIIHILSSKLYDNSEPIQQFIKNTSINASLPALLNDNGVRVDIKTASSLFFPIVELNRTTDDFSSVTTTSNLSKALPEIINLYQLTFFRFVPQELKGKFYVKLVQREDGTDMDEYHKFNSLLHVSTTQDTFKLFHLNGPHAPYHLNESLRYVELPQNWIGYKSQAKASLKISYSLLTSLKQNKVYNRSSIFIIGDHGTGAGTELVHGETPLMLVKAFIVLNVTFLS